MKKKLIESLKALPMTMEDKEKFAEVVCSKTSSGGSNSMFKWRYYSSEFMNKPELMSVFAQIPIDGNMDLNMFIQKDESDGRNILYSFSFAMIGSGMGHNPKGFMISNKILYNFVITDFYKVIFNICQSNNIDYNTVISQLESVEITEEEFMKGVVVE